MPKKIYDIVPPKVAHKLERTIKEMGATAVKAPKKRAMSTSKTPQAPHRKARSFMVKATAIGSTLLVLVLGIYFYNTLQSATIDLSPKLETITLAQTISADKLATAVNAEKNTIPAYYVEVEKEDSQSFPATGLSNSDSKAEGTIRVYNKISPYTTFSLKAGTHFLSDSGKYFVTLAKVTIPAATKSGPGSISVKVQAEGTGKDFNIGPSKFSVPKLSGTAYYYTIWADSSDDMAGGSTGKVKKVTKDDLQEAQDVVTKKLLQDATDELKAKLSVDQILVEGALLTNVVSFSADAKPDALVDSFNQKASVKVSALVFDKKDLESFTKEKGEEKLLENYTLLESSQEANATLKSLDMQKGIISLNFSASVKQHRIIDTQKLAGLFKGKTEKEVEGIAQKTYGEDLLDTKIKLWPFWVNTVPLDSNKVEINVNLEQ